MKKILTALLPFILVAQLPMHASKFIPAEWMKSLQYGLKWTELMMNGYPGASDDGNEETIPEGEVTTTVVMASAIPHTELIRIRAEELCDSNFGEEIAIQARQAVQVRMEMQKIRRTGIRTLRVVQM